MYPTQSAELLAVLRNAHMLLIGATTERNLTWRELQFKKHMQQVLRTLSRHDRLSGGQ